MLKETEEKLAQSLTAETTDLIPFLPYLLQDFWELGTNPDTIIKLINKHVSLSEKSRILDLACGKGAVSVKLAEKFRIKVKGVDITPEFVEYAAQKAKEYSVGDLCEFVIDDVNEAVKKEKDYDCVVYGAIGDVMGNRAETLKKLKAVVKPGGYLIFDNYDFAPLNEWKALFDEAGLVLIETISDNNRVTVDDSDTFKLVADSGLGMAAMTKRANELIEKHPEKKAIFEGYIKSQKEEYNEIDSLSNDQDVTWILKKVSY